MTGGQIFTKIGNLIENRQIFMLLNCNCAKLANFEDFLNMLRGAVFSWTRCIMTRLCVVEPVTLSLHLLLPRSTTNIILIA